MTATATPGPIRSADSLLRFAMRADAIITALFGVALAVVAEPLSSQTGLSTTTEYAVGAVFVICGLGGLVLAALPSVRRAGVVMVIANIVAMVAAVVIVLADWLPLTAIGLGLFVASGVYTAFFGCLQYVGVRRLRA